MDGKNQDSQYEIYDNESNNFTNYQKCVDDTNNVSINSINNTNNKKNNFKKIISIIFLILSILNMIIIFPGVCVFSVIWLIFGGLSGDLVYARNILYFCWSYLIFSVVLLIKLIRCVKNNGEKILSALLVSIVCFMISIFIFNLLNIG